METPVAETPAVETTAPTKERFNPLTDEAFRWMTSSKSIPGAFAPILYCGPRTVVEISQIIGRPIELDEAKRLVQSDGEKQTCSISEQEFQPVAYVPYCPGGLHEQIAGGETLLTARLPFGGQFHFIGGKPVPVSGSIFHYDESSDSYDFATSSPLVILAREFQKKTGKLKWGVPLDQVDEVLAKKEARNKIHQKARELVNQFIESADRRNRKGRRGLTRVGEAVEIAEKDHKKHASKHYKRKEEKEEAVD